MRNQIQRTAGHRGRVASIVLALTTLLVLGAAQAGEAASGVTISTTADVGLSAATSPAQPNTLEPLRYSFTIRNNGPATATSTEFSASLPDVPFDIRASQGLCSAGYYERSIRCPLGDLRKGAAATVEVSVQPRDAGTKFAYAGAASSVTDPDQANNDLTVSTPVRWGTALPASCSGSISPGLNGTAYAGCTQGFTISEDTAVTLALQPGPDFTSDLAAYIYGYGAGSVAGVHTFYFDGQPVDGQQAQQLILPAGDWQLYVRAGDGWQTPSELCINPISGCYYGFPWRIPIPIRSSGQVGNGAFGASVSAR